MRQPPIVQEILNENDVNTLLAHVSDVGVACAMARMGDADPRRLLSHLLDVAEQYDGDPSSKRWMILVGLIDVLADEVRNSDTPNDLELVRRTNTLMAQTYQHYGGLYAVQDNESIGP